jgi:hypothetical protein
MKYLKRFNESNRIESGANIVSSIRSEIEDILVEFTFGYDIRFVRYDTPNSNNNFQLQILPKGYPESELFENHTILIDEDLLDDLRRVCNFIELEIGFKYSHSYYYAQNIDDPEGKQLYGNDIFYSSGRLVSVIQMFFTGPNINESSAFESYQGANNAGLVRVYGKENLEECDSLMLDIKDLSYDLLDLGFEVKIDYSHSTMFERDKTPKIEVNIIGRNKLFDESYDDVVLPVIEDIKRYVSNLGFSTGGHLSDTSTSTRYAYHQSNKFMTYKLLIQK